MLQTPFSLGSISLPSNIFCAPLAGCSDYPFRQMTASYSPGLIFCEMVKMDALIRYDPHTFRMLDFHRDMHPIGAQLCGSKPHLAGPCAKIIEDLGFDVVDLNCGCPVDKVTKDGSGSALLKHPQKIGEIISNMRAAVDIPVTVKIRAGWDFQSICAPQITRIAEEAGADAICIHGRTRSQGYRGPANWQFIKECKQAAKNIKVIANGDICDPVSAREVFLQTQCDAILIARGTMGQPWIVEDIAYFLANNTLIKHTNQEYKKAFLQHLSYILSYQVGRKALLDIRRISSWYMKLGKGMKPLRDTINRSHNLSEILSHVQNFDWDSVHFQPLILQEEECNTCAG